MAGAPTSVMGSSPTGVNFRLVFFKTLTAATAAEAHRPPATNNRIANVIVDSSGNPPDHTGGKPRNLNAVDLLVIKVCLLQPVTHGSGG